MRVVLVLALCASVQAADFAKDVLPVLRTRCFSCHSAEKRRPKGKLRLDGREWIEVGGKKGRVVVPGKPDQSSLYTRATLPEDHDDVMPPDGEPLEPAQLDALREWIAAGADFGTWTGEEKPRKKEAPAAPATDDRFKLYERLAEGVPPPPATAVDALRDAGARVAPVVPKSPLLRVEFVADPDRATDKTMKLLAPLRRHIAILSLAGTKISDRAIDEIGKLQRLVRLDLQKTAVTDAALKALAKTKPKELRRVNLYGTGVTDAGLDALGTIQTLQTLYVWDTKITGTGIASLRMLLPRCKVHHKRNLPAPEGRRGEDSERRRRR